ncbi:hypothetical protein V1J52_05300 [Streptomyces sp. TRM 70351]|uniref:hypothetical protein n=1 Tax=Streptomyces sp. TRM 70351 TaxID=3116552 RepID=UPI002E7C16E5|nr:hypothetical protein [Streptomyces sp. TRM 70351]MEE1927610.1 hypothetical protein [Streptomyces sp. TRM 70351]
MRVQTATRPGTPGVPNEDWVSTTSHRSGTGGALVVLDGVTPPPGDDGCVHGVPWYTARLGAALLELSASRRDMTLTQCLAEAVARTAAAHRSTCDLSHVRTPQATVVAARWDEEAVEHLVLSDSVLLLVSPSGAVTPVLDDRLDALRPAVRELPRAERVARIEALRNAEGGFHTAAADPAVAELAVTGTTPRAAVRSLAALTDGASRWTEVFGLGDWAGLYAVLRAEGPEALIGRVRDAEAADPSGTAYPRGKTSDDATAALVEF